MLSLQLLGGAQLVGPEGPIPGPASHRHRLGLLTLLAIHHPRALSRDKVMALLWPESDEEHGRSLLNLAVHVIRKAAGEDVIVSSGDGLLLDPAKLSIDVREFEKAITAGETELAMSLYAGPLLDGFFIPGANEFDRVIDRERERLARLFSGALQSVAESRSSRGDHKKAVDIWLRLAWAEPFNSRIALRLVQALEGIGDRAGALQHARMHAHYLAEEYGAQPDAEFVSYAKQLRAQPPVAGAGVDRVSQQLYLKGAYAWNRRTREGLERAVEYFRQAVHAAPHYAQAHAGLSEAYAVLGFYDVLAPRRAFEQARSAAEKAIELNPELAEPYATLGYVSLYYDWNFSEAEESFLHAISLNPAYSVAHQWYANMLVASGRFDEAVREMAMAHQLDPLSLVASAGLGWVYYYAGRLEEAIQQGLRTLDLDGNFAMGHEWIGLPYLEAGHSREAVASFEQACLLSPTSVHASAVLAHALAITGDTARAQAILQGLLEKQEYLPAYEIAKIYLALGRNDDVFTWLERALQQRSHSIVFLNVDPQLSSIRSDPRFIHLVRAAGLAPTPASSPWNEVP